MGILPDFGFVDIFSLQNQGQRLICSGIFTRKGIGFVEIIECVVIVGAIFFVRCATFRMAPDPILKYFIPNIPATGLG